MLASLTPREERVCGCALASHEHRLHIGRGRQQFSVTRERIRQIEAKALKLKHRAAPGNSAVSWTTRASIMNRRGPRTNAGFSFRIGDWGMTAPVAAGIEMTGL